MKVLQFPKWLTRDNSVQSKPPEPFIPSVSVIMGYAKDIEKHGWPLDSDMPNYFRKCAAYFENNDRLPHTTKENDND